LDLPLDLWYDWGQIRHSLNRQALPASVGKQRQEGEEYMFKDLQVTLYDVFGYLFPGFVVLVAVAILFGPIFGSTAGLLLPGVPTTIADWSVVGIVAYILGHLAQAIGNLVGRRPIKEILPSTKSKVLHELPDYLVDQAESKARSILEIQDTEKIDSDSLYELCDQFVVQSDKKSAIANREIYIYREGYYRGMTVSLLLLSLSLLILTVRTLFTGTPLRLSDGPPPVSAGWLGLLAAGLLSVVGAWLSFRRYRRFGEYRIKQAIIGFLVLPEPAKDEPQDESG
jgi:hypothetical protein